MESSKSLRNKLIENYEELALLEAIDAFDQIRSLVVEDSEKRPCLAKESLLQLFQLILTIIREGCLEVSDESKIYRLLDIIEEDVYRLANNAEIILDTVHKIQTLLSGTNEK